MNKVVGVDDSKVTARLLSILSTALGGGPTINPELMQGVEIFKGHMKGLEGPIADAFAALLWVINGRNEILISPFQVISSALVLAYASESREQVDGLSTDTVLGTLHYGDGLVVELILESMPTTLMSMYDGWSETQEAKFIPATATIAKGQGIFEELTTS